MGRLVKEKGQKYLIESFSKVEESNWKLVILGDGPMKKELILLAENLNIKERVLFPGAVKDVDSWLQKSSIFAFSSISEGFPNALVEAMSSNLACVSFNCDAGPNEIITNNKNGFLVDVYDIDTFTEKIKNSILRKEFSIEAGKINDNLNIDTISRRYLDFCKGINI